MDQDSPRGSQSICRASHRQDLKAEGCWEAERYWVPEGCWEAEGYWVPEGCWEAEGYWVPECCWEPTAHRPEELLIFKVVLPATCWVCSLLTDETKTAGMMKVLELTGGKKRKGTQGKNAGPRAPPSLRGVL